MDVMTADLCDGHEALLEDGSLRVVDPMFSSFGGRAAFHGPIATLRLFEDNGLVRTALETPGAGRVLVIDGGGSLRRALVGDQLAALAVKNGWAGIVVNGCIRDSRAIGEMDVGVLALDTHPRKTVKRNQGEADVAVSFGGVTLRPGEWLFADEDGVLVSATPLPQ
ncbi:MAG: ribonuclease E activity regulator RraA [Gammaproteobacteria bacterium]|nr:ribonuclease E activity regulator RraA [Gammaproteobacteria bacterium]MBU1646247.1 ribonuclease E activity regulator RraA [Gammaproteobacteria bacterium]MBU1970745.1 ribonuclease E activity regulator RraA [Gammaproteobacteria bacterium]